ncbi:MAG: hypothetical protein MUO26_06195 [Methanotrichaceae archaeon]|nr:hypothetical protein [Methanotrichaceae archaeon]
MIITISVSVYTVVKPTELVERVAIAIERIFPGIIMDIQEDRIEAKGGPETLQNFHKLIREQRILDTARFVMFDGMLGNLIQFNLNKQAALMSKVSFPLEEEPLGSIHVQITGGEKVIEWLTPKTVDGVPVREISFEEALRDV